MTIENEKEEAIPESWIEQPNVTVKKYWFDDGESIYPKRFVDVNGVLLTLDGADELRHEISQALSDEP